jgi:hypothetical protein
MAPISQPGSDYQIASISLDAGYARDLILMLTDVHAVLDHLCLDGTPAPDHRPGRARPILKTRRRPKRSPAAVAVIIPAAKAMLYAVSVHCSDARPT